MKYFKTYSNFINEANNVPRGDLAIKELEKEGSELNWLDDANAATKKIWKKAGVNPEDENTVILYSYVAHSWPDVKKILKKNSVNFKELEDPNSAGESMIVFVKESTVTESLTIPTMAAMLLGLGIATRIGLMSDEKYTEMIGSIKPTAKAIIKNIPIIGDKIRNKELKDYQTTEVEKYLNDEITDKDIVEILKENPKLKKAIEDVSINGSNYKEYYKLIKEIGGVADDWGNTHKKFKSLRKKLSDGKVLETTLTEGKYSSTKDADDVFFLWDDTVDNDRVGIDHGTMSGEGKKSSSFTFDSTVKELPKFIKAVKGLIKKNNWKSEWTGNDTNLAIFEAYSDEQRMELADKGFALSDGSFPIKNLQDLKNAIMAYGRAKDQARTAKFIVKRAKALGAEDLIPDTADFQKSLKEAKAYKSATRNELALYIINLQDEIKAYKQRGNKKYAEGSARDLEEVRAELASRKK